MLDAKPPAEPGSVTIRPTRAEAEKAKDAFYDILGIIKKEGQLPLQKIAAITGDKTLNTEVNMSKKISNKSFSLDQQRQILDYIFSKASLISGQTRKDISAHQDALYFALLNYCAVNDTSQDGARARTIGTYKLWRFSVEHENEIVMGRLDISEDPTTRAVCVQMVQRQKAQDGVRGRLERLSGYLFRVSHMYLVLLMDEMTKDLRISLFPRSKVDEVGTDVSPTSIFSGKCLHIIHMDGFELGIDGSSGFFSPIHLELVDDVEELADLDDSLDVADEGRLPKRIVNKLKRSGSLRRL